MRWTPLDEEAEANVAVGLRPVFAHAGGLPFCGRAEVFEPTLRRLERCVAGGFETVLLAGEPGVDKTRLAQELAAGVHGGVGPVSAGGATRKSQFRLFQRGERDQSDEALHAAQRLMARAPNR